MKNCLLTFLSVVLFAALGTSCGEPKEDEKVAITEVKLNKNSVVLNVGETTELTATVLPENAADKSVIWSSSNDNIATVSGDGVVTAVAYGEAAITVTTNNGGKTAECKVKVSDGVVHVTEVILDKEYVELEPEDTVQLSATVKPDNAKDQTLSWKSSDDAVATVSQIGLVTGVATGDAVITVTTNDGGFTAECAVKVWADYIPVSEVIIKESSAVDIGRTKKLMATVLPENATDKTVSWRSSDGTVVSIDQEGNITGVSEGEATITVTTTDGGKTGQCLINSYPLRNEKWARSHIVWIEDESKSDGGYLTFAVTRGDNGDIPANVQGVLFRWGSLVAMSPGSTNYSHSQILYSPAGHYTYNWSDVPSFDGATEDYLNDHDYPDDDFVNYNSGTGFDAAADKGDICRYISSKGWVEGNWRMPTASEYSALWNPSNGGANVAWAGSNWIVWVGGVGTDNNYANGFRQPESGYFLGAGVTADDNKENPDTGCAFPASGQRDWNTEGTVRIVNSSGYAWSASSYGTTTTVAHVYVGVVRNNTSNRTNGIPVRCVKQ